MSSPKSAIDALPYYSAPTGENPLFLDLRRNEPDATRFNLLNLLASAIKKLPQGGSVIIATDNEPAGKKYVDMIKGIAEIAQRNDLGIIEHRPEKEGQNWNDVLKAVTPDNTHNSRDMIR